MLKLAELAAQLARAGITSVAGDVVGDGSWFEPTLVHPAWENYDLNWWYAAPVSGLGFNDNSIDIEYAPGDTRRAAGEARRSRPTSATSPWRTTPAPCRAARTRPSTSSATPGTLSVWAQGNVEAGRRVRTEYFALPDPNLFAARALRAALAAQGIAVLGGTRSTTDSMRYEIVRRGAAARRGDAAGRSGTGSSPSSTPARTGTPR